MSLDSARLDNFKSIRNLPTLPGVAMKILEAVRSEETSLNVIADILSKDPPLTAKILGLINSAFYRLPSKVTSISHAVKLLGIQTVKKVALSFSLVRSFAGDPQGTFDYGKFWRDSLIAAVFSRLLAEKLLPARVEDAFTLGLLHDIGVLALNVIMPKQYSLVIQEMALTGCPMPEAEERIIGFDHQDVGSFLTRSWDLPEIFFQPIARHHCPEGQEGSVPGVPDLTRILHLASLVVDLFNSGDKDRPLALLNYYLIRYGYAHLVPVPDLVEETHAQTRAIFDLFEVRVKEEEFMAIIDEARDALIHLANQDILEMAGQQERIRGLQEQADRDSLTGLYNYRRFHQLLEEHLDQATQMNIPLTLLLADIDFFKKVNDTYGHPAGDYVLQTLGKLLAQVLRSSDILARHGGEEFGLILPLLPLEKALLVVERVRRTVEGFPFAYEDRPIPLTMSFGVAFLSPGSRIGKDALIKLADSALYEAKKTGRNKFCLSICSEKTAGAVRKESAA